ncbi:MAG: exo-alpha-sialidase [Dehalococcoidia bacterium]
MTSKVVVTLGTRKGVFLYSSDEARERWALAGPFLPGQDVNHATVDARTGTLYATGNDPWFGPRVMISDDLGANWRNATRSPHFEEGSPLGSVARLWRIEPGRDSEPGRLWCGVDPAALFRSDDGGETWDEVQGLSTHETRAEWAPGNGGLITHSIVLDPTRTERMWVGMSSPSVFRSDDGGNSWRPANRGIRNGLIRYEPNAEEYPEIGQCVHHVVYSAQQDRLYAQVHWGTVRSDDGGEHWVDITSGLPSDFGMVIAAHPRKSDVAYVAPLIAGEFRVPPEGRLRVYRTSDAGASWEPLTAGLPQEHAYMGMYREGMAIDRLDPAGLYLGTNTGQLYASADEGATWRELTSNLPPISSVNVAVLE